MLLISTITIAIGYTFYGDAIKQLNHPTLLQHLIPKYDTGLVENRKVTMMTQALGLQLTPYSC